MAKLIFFTKEQLIQESGLSKATFYRRLKDLNVRTSGKLMPKKEADKIRQALRSVPIKEKTIYTQE